jgi:L-asparaginase/N4-(beta-N-acetylglucosaminyl)-L-asparaginase
MPLLLSTWSFGLHGNAVAWPALRDGGSGLDAVEAAARVVEADPEVDSVGYGGLPDAEGNMTLDAAVMLSPALSGSVCAVRTCLHVVSLARRVMEDTEHSMLAGAGADALAKKAGLDGAVLLSDEARRRWEAWRADPKTVDQSRDAGTGLRPIDHAEGGRLFGRAARGPADERHDDTIGTLAIDRSGRLAGACSTSGTPYKVPGRVGDSPIIGHGLYVDPEFGAAVGTGSGELISGVCGTFLAVELMRRGAAPRDALQEVIERIGAAFRIEPEHQAAFIALSPRGAFSSASLRPGFRIAVTDETRNAVIEPEFVLLGE